MGGSHRRRVGLVLEHFIATVGKRCAFMMFDRIKIQMLAQVPRLFATTIIKVESRK